MLTVGIIGYGLSGRYLQAPFFEANPNFRLKTIVTNSQNPKESFPNVIAAKNIDEVISDPEIDLISICSPNATHYLYAKQCLLAGKHVLVEKPFTATLAEAQELIELAQKQAKILTVFQNRRFDSDFMTVKNIVQSNVLGELLAVEIRFDRYKPLLNPKKWKEIATPASGIIYDLGSHIIDQALDLFGTPKHVWGETFTQREGSEIDDAFDIRLKYDKLRVWLKSSLLVREETPRYALYGTKGSFIKYGLDIQEDQLKAGLTPNSANFGKEPNSTSGILNTEINGLPFHGKVETMTGNWNILFQNIFEAITEGKELLVKPSEIVEQIKIIEAVKTVD